MIQGSNPGMDKRCFLLQEHPDWLWGPPEFFPDGKAVAA